MFVGDILGVDRNESVAASRGDYCGAQLAQNPRQEVAPDSGMLIDEHPHAREAAAIEAVHVAARVSRFSSAIERRQVRRAREHAASVEQRRGSASGVFIGTHAFDCADDAGLVGLQHFADAFIDLDAVTVERNVAAGHHDAGALLRDRVGDQCRRGNPAGVFHPAPRIEYRLDTGAHNPLGAWPQIAGDDHAAISANIADGQQVAQRPFDVDVSFEVGDVFHQAAQAAGAKRQRDRRIIEK